MAVLEDVNGADDLVELAAVVETLVVVDVVLEVDEDELELVDVVSGAALGSDDVGSIPTIELPIGPLT